MANMTDASALAARTNVMPRSARVLRARRSNGPSGIVPACSTDSTKKRTRGFWMQQENALAMASKAHGTAVGVKRTRRGTAGAKHKPHEQVYLFPPMRRNLAVSRHGHKVEVLLWRMLTVADLRMTWFYHQLRL